MTSRPDSGNLGQEAQDGRSPLVLITRPEAAARRFVAELAPLQLDCVIAPLMRIETVPHDQARLHGARALVLTSVNAVPAAGPGQGRLAYCVGPATADAARQASFEVIEGPGDARRLAPMLAGKTGLLHPHGRHVTEGLPVEGMVVYDQVATDLPEAGQEALEGSRPILWPLFSPRSARLAAAAMAGATVRAPITLLAISEAAAKAFGPWPDEIPIARTPDSDGLLGAIKQQLMRLRVVAPPPAG